MSDSKSTVDVEREQPGRFPTSRFGGVIWTRLQGDSLREINAYEQRENPAENPQFAESIADKFNGVESVEPQ